MGDPINLVAAEMTIAAMVGVMRQVTNLRDGRKDAHGASLSGGWQIHIEGACSEYAVAKYLGLFWNGNLGNLKADDVGPFQVRSTEHANGRLILHKGDPGDRLYVLVTGRCPSYVLQGWISGADGQNEEYWTDPQGGRPAYFVPTKALRPMSEFPIRGAAK